MPAQGIALGNVISRELRPERATLTRMKKPSKKSVGHSTKSQPRGSIACQTSRIAPSGRRFSDMDLTQGVALGWHRIALSGRGGWRSSGLVKDLVKPKRSFTDAPDKSLIWKFSGVLLAR